MPPLRVIGGEKATVTEAYRAAEYLRGLFGGFRGNLGGILETGPDDSDPWGFHER